MILAVKHLPFDMIPQFRKRPEDDVKGPALVVRKQAGYIFEQNKRGLFGSKYAGNLEKQRSASIFKAFSVSGDAEALARKSAANEVEIGHFISIDLSCVIAKPLSFRIKKGAIALVRMRVDLAVPDAFCAGYLLEGRSETARARK